MKGAVRVRAVWLASALVLSVVGCHGGKVAAPAPALVVALPVHPDAGAAAGGVVRYPVEVAARYSTPMSFRVPGKLIERKVRIGDTVKKGQVVARLDPIDAEKQLASARAALDAADHRLVFAKQQLDRDTAQSAQNLIAANQLEQTQDAFSAAQAGREQAAAQLVVARNNLQYNSLVADHDGVITSENADTGQVVAAGQAVYGLAWSGDTDVTLDAAASDLGRIVIGQAASVTFPALPGRTFQASVREITPTADPQSRTYRVKLTLEHPGDVVRLGMTGDATLAPVQALADRPPTAAGRAAALGTAGAARAGGAAGAAGAASAAGAGGAAGATGGRAAAPLGSGGRATDAAGASVGASMGDGGQVFTVPATAIFHEGNSPAVWVVGANDSLELRAVTVRSYSDHSTVVTGGLKDGDVVVLAGVHTVYAGERVTPVRPLFDGEGDVAGPAPAGEAGVRTAGAGDTSGAGSTTGGGGTAGVRVAPGARVASGAGVARVAGVAQ